MIVNLLSHQSGSNVWVARVILVADDPSATQDLGIAVLKSLLERDANPDATIEIVKFVLDRPFHPCSWKDLGRIFVSILILEVGFEVHSLRGAVRHLEGCLHGRARIPLCLLLQRCKERGAFIKEHGSSGHGLSDFS